MTVDDRGVDCGMVDGGAEVVAARDLDEGRQNYHCGLANVCVSTVCVSARTCCM